MKLGDALSHNRVYAHKQRELKTGNLLLSAVNYGLECPGMKSIMVSFNQKIKTSPLQCYGKR